MTDEIFIEDLSESAEPEETKEEKIEKEKKKLIHNLQENNLGKMREKVAFVLNNSMATRNSDIDLCWSYWTTFHKEIFNGKSLTKEVFYKSPKMASIVRERAKIQNEYGLFQADSDVKKHRGKLEEEYKESAIEDKPVNLPIYSVYVDETGKTEKYISVGSLWILDGFSAFGVSIKLEEWKDQQNIDFECHFAKLSDHRLQSYKDFFIKFLGLNPTAAFKVITVERQGLNKINDALTDLTFHLLHKGITHEHETGRAPLPRRLQVNIDPEELGSDSVKIANLKERLNSQNLEGLYIGKFDTLDSKSSMYIQAADLVISSVNRKINFPESVGKAKDEFSDFVLGMLDYSDNLLEDYNKDIDKSIVFNLMQKD